MEVGLRCALVIMGFGLLLRASFVLAQCSEPIPAVAVSTDTKDWKAAAFQLDRGVIDTIEDCTMMRYPVSRSASTLLLGKAGECLSQSAVPSSIIDQAGVASFSSAVTDIVLPKRLATMFVADYGTIRFTKVDSLVISHLAGQWLNTADIGLDGTNPTFSKMIFFAKATTDNNDAQRGDPLVVVDPDWLCVREVNVTTGATTTTVGTCGLPPRSPTQQISNTNNLKAVSFNLLVAAVVSRTEGGAARRVYYILESSAIWRIQPDAPSSAAFVIYNAAVGSEFDPTAAMTTVVSYRTDDSLRTATTTTTDALLIVFTRCNVLRLEPTAAANGTSLSNASSPADMTLTGSIVPRTGGVSCQKGLPILGVAVGDPNATMLYVAVGNSGGSSSSPVTRSVCTAAFASTTSSSSVNDNASPAAPPNPTTATTTDGTAESTRVALVTVGTIAGVVVITAVAVATVVIVRRRRDRSGGSAISADTDPQPPLFTSIARRPSTTALYEGEQDGPSSSRSGAAVDASVFETIHSAYAVSSGEEMHSVNTTERGAADGNAAVPAPTRAAPDPEPKTDAGGSSVWSEFVASPSDASTTNAVSFQLHQARCEQVRRGHYQRGRLLGRGAMGAVYACMLRDGTMVAMKSIGLAGDDDAMNEQAKLVMREVELQTTVLHPNVVQVYGVCVDKQREREIHIFMEHLTGGSLADLVRQLDARLNETVARKYVAQIVDALILLHSRRIVHRDLKCDNVLVDATSGRIKLADFGTARTVGHSNHSLASTIIGTPYFMAPEVIAGAEDENAVAGYGVEADIWSLGILVAELLDRGKHPWPSFKNASLLFMHIYGPTGIPIIPEGISPAAADFIARCTARDPTLRPTAVDLKRHNWIAHPSQRTAV